MRDAHLLQAIYGQPWAIEPSVGTAMLGVMLRHTANERLSQDEILAAIDSSGHAIRPRAPGPSTSGSVAVISILGVIASRAAMVENISTGPGASVESISRRFKSAMADPEILTVALDLDSPGGSVYGITELASEIYAARGRKHVIAVCNGMCASAAYWLASAATELVASPSAQVGSIGVLTAHEDLSKAMETAGVRVTLVHHGANKVEQSPFGPLSDSAREHLQASVDQYGERFVRDIAAGRGVTPAVVASRFGQGRMFGSQEALNRGLVDRIATLDQIIDEARARKRGPYAPRQANAQMSALTAAAQFPRRAAARAALDQIEADARFPKRAAARAEMDRLEERACFPRRAEARARLALLG